MPCGSGTTTSFTLSPQPPFRLDYTAWALRRQSHNAVDRWDGSRYRRTMALPAGTVDVRVGMVTASPEAPSLCVTVEGGGAAEASLQCGVTDQLRRLLGIDAALDTFHARAAQDPLLGPLAARFRGMRPPRFPSLFEAIANAIACQQVSLNVGILMLNRLAARFGRAGVDGRSFPVPADLLAHAAREDLRALGFSYTKARTLLDVAEACVSGELDEAQLAALSDRDAIARLTSLRGIGRWSAEYTLLRGLGRLHVFPGDDVGAQRHLARWLGLEAQPGYNETQTALSPWGDHAGLVYLHLLLLRLYGSQPGESPRR